MIKDPSNGRLAMKAELLCSYIFVTQYSGTRSLLLQVLAFYLGVGNTQVVLPD